jgi:hypothetical protein
MFPKRRLITSNRVAWLEGEVHSWINSRSRVGDSDKVQPKHNLPENRLTGQERYSVPSDASQQLMRRPNYLRDED